LDEMVFNMLRNKSPLIIPKKLNMVYNTTGNFLNISINDDSVLSGAYYSVFYEDSIYKGIDHVAWDKSLSFKVNVDELALRSEPYLFKIEANDGYNPTVITYANVSVFSDYPPSEFNFKTVYAEANVSHYLLEWNPSNHAINYTIYYSLKPITEINSTLTVLARGITSTNYTVSNLPAKVYYFRIEAINNVTTQLSDDYFTLNITASNILEPLNLEWYWWVLIGGGSAGMVYAIVYFVRKRRKTLLS